MQRRSFILGLASVGSLPLPPKPEPKCIITNYNYQYGSFIQSFNRIKRKKFPPVFNNLLTSLPKTNLLTSLPKI